MKRISFFLFLMVFFSIDLFANKIAFLKEYEILKFNPSKGQKIDFKIELKEDANLSVFITTNDKKLIKEIVKDKFFKKGIHNFSWDGKDFKNNIVADEAYFIQIKANNKDQNNDINVLAYGIFNVPLNIYERERLEFHLGRTSRVMIRAAIENGPLVKNILNWKPMKDGFKTIDFDGYDEDKVINVFDFNYTITVMALPLPKNSIITEGNKEIDFFDYYHALGYSASLPSLSDKKIEENPLFFMPSVLLMQPKIKAKIKNKKAYVDIEEKYTKYLDLFGYEVVFYIDGKYFSEEKQGYMPILLDLEDQNQTKNKKILTINVIPYKYGVGMATKSVFLKE